MAPFLYSSAFLLLAIGIAHSWLGERYILIRLFRRSELPPLFGSDAFTRQTLRFAWHITTVAWFGFAGVLIALARAEVRDQPIAIIGAIVAGTFLVTGVIALAASRGRHLSWPVFLLVGVLVMYATRS